MPFLRVMAILVLIFGLPCRARAASLNELRNHQLSERGQSADLVLEFRRKPRYKVVESGKPSLYVVDFVSALFRPTRKRLRPTSSLSEYMVISQYDRRTVRLVIQRDPQARIRVVPDGSKGVRVEVRHPATGFRPGDVPVLAQGEAPTKKVTQVTANAFPSRSPSDKPRIMIDPGHGGRDPGAVGKNTTDKAIALAVALQLKEIFQEDEEVEVFFTRTEDRFVPLEDRAALARRVGADVFVSLHANAGPPVARGFEVWYLSAKGSRREAHRLLRGAARRKAKSVDLIQKIIVDKQREGTLNKSSLLAGYLNQALSKTGQRSRGVGEENFAVLRSVEVPSVLLELGFLTNPAEERRLLQPAFQRKQAVAIKEGVLAYLRSQGMLGSSIPAKTLYAVRKNDSLSVISHRFGVDLVDLASANGLGKNSPLYVGQLLEIPNDPVGDLIGAHIE